MMDKGDGVSEIIFQRTSEVSEFIYGGSMVTYDNDCGKDARARIPAANQSYQALSKIVKRRYIKKPTNLKIYTTLIKPKVLHSCELWAMTEKMKSSLTTWEQQILRKIHDPIKHQNGWRTQTNNESQVM